MTPIESRIAEHARKVQYRLGLLLEQLAEEGIVPDSWAPALLNAAIQAALATFPGRAEVADWLEEMSKAVRAGGVTTKLN